MWLDNSDWNLPLIRQAFGRSVVAAVRYHAQGVSSGPDWLAWKPSPSRVSSSAYAWVHARVASPIDPVISSVWSPCIPTKWSILVWGVLKGRIPSNDVLRCHGFSLASKFHYCVDAHEESLQHVFVDGHLAVSAWATLFPGDGSSGATDTIAERLFRCRPSPHRSAPLSALPHLFGLFGRIEPSLKLR